MEQPYAGKASIQESFNEIKITIPSKTVIFVPIFFTFWLCGWAFGEVSALTMLLKGGFASFFMLFWLAGWTAGGLFALRALVWYVAGKEIITVGQGELTIDKKNLIFYKAKTYSLNDARRFRVRDYKPAGTALFGRRNDLGGFSQTGTIQFDYGMKTIKCAAGVDDAEATFILQKLKDKHLLAERHF